MFDLCKWLGYSMPEDPHVRIPQTEPAPSHFGEQNACKVPVTAVQY